MKRHRIVLMLVLMALVVSTALNGFFFTRGRSYYLQLNALRLDPVGLRQYPTTADPVPGSSQRRVVFLGDSRAEAWAFSGGSGCFEVYNRGVASQTSAQVLARFEAHVATLHSDIVVIQVGVNDLKTIPLFPDRRDEIVADCKANIEALVLQSLELEADVVVTTIFPLGKVPLERRLFWSGDVAVAIDEVNAFIASLEQERVVVLDTGAVLANDGGRVREAYSRDLLHLNEAGYSALNKTLEPLLETMTR